MARQPKRSGALVLRLIVGLALVAAPLLAAPPAPTPRAAVSGQERIRTPAAVGVRCGSGPCPGV